MEKRFVPQPAAVGEHNWCVPYAMATVLGKSYDEVYNKTCDIIGKKFRGLGRGVSPPIVTGKRTFFP